MLTMRSHGLRTMVKMRSLVYIKTNVNTAGEANYLPGQSGCPHSIPLARRLGDPRYRSASG